MIWLDWITKIVSAVALLAISGLVAFNMVLGYRNQQILGNMITAFVGTQESFRYQQTALENLVTWTVPPEEWAGVIELHQQLRANGSELGDYLIYCNMHSGYWRANDQGYTPDRKEAKRFTAHEGLILVLDRARNSDPYDCYTLVRVGKEADEA